MKKDHRRGPPLLWKGARYSLAALMIALWAATARAETSSSQSAAASADAGSRPQPAASAPAEAQSDLFAQGARYWSVTAGVSHHATIAWVYFTQLLVNRYVTDDVAIMYGGIVEYADAQRATAGAIAGPEIGIRWHVAKGTRWSTYVDNVVGAVIQQHPLTDHSLRFNFDLQPGVGTTYRLDSTTMCQGGFRWHHLSNARIRGKAHNFGYDGPLWYVGLMRSF